jgi:four helix bundle protein
MRILNFEQSIAWQKSRILTLDIYACFEGVKDYSFRDQIQRAALSVMNNIAEGFERNTNKELLHFLYIAKGSCGEVRSMLYIAQPQHYLSEKDFDRIKNEAEEVSKITSGLIKKVYTSHKVT